MSWAGFSSRKRRANEKRTRRAAPAAPHSGGQHLESAQAGPAHRRIGPSDGKAFASARDGRWQEAEEAAGQAAQEWTEAGNYTHIFIRHTDIDALTAAFCDYRGAIAGRETGEIYAVYLRLSTGIRSLQSMEKLSAGSIF